MITCDLTKTIRCFDGQAEMCTQADFEGVPRAGDYITPAGAEWEEKVSKVIWGVDHRPYLVMETEREDLEEFNFEDDDFGGLRRQNITEAIESETHTGWRLTSKYTFWSDVFGWTTPDKFDDHFCDWPIINGQLVGAEAHNGT